MDPIATEILTAAGGAIAAKIFDGPFKTLEVLNNPELYSKLALKKYFFNMTAFGRTFKASCF